MDFLGNPGGLLDFTEIYPVIPTIVVPDLHARADFMLDILKYKPVIKETDINGKKNILDLMRSGSIRVVCVGDGLHSELNKLRWLEAYNDYEKEITTGNAMKQEMLEGLSLMEIVMRCKCSFPEYFHFLKGNHENIMNTNRLGNHPFRKFAQEGEMVRAFMSSYYGDDVLDRIRVILRTVPM